MIQIIHQEMLSNLSEEARHTPRLRKNLNFHSSNDAACHRLLNALEPGTYVQPHCHLSPEKEETLVVLSGSFGVLIFANDGTVLHSIVLAAGQENFGITIPVGVFHSMLALEPNSVFFEAKAGPYVAITAAEKASWAPSETELACAAYLAKMRAYFPH